MVDLGYLFSLAFSGADLWRAVWIGLIASLFCTGGRTPLKLLIAAAVVDAAWPYADMLLSGFSARDVSIAMGYAIRSTPDLVLVIAVRLAGIYALISGGYWLRLKLHGHKPQTKAVKVPLPY